MAKPSFPCSKVAICSRVPETLTHELFTLFEFRLTVFLDVTLSTGIVLSNFLNSSFTHGGLYSQHSKVRNLSNLNNQGISMSSPMTRNISPSSFRLLAAVANGGVSQSLLTTVGSALCVEPMIGQNQVLFPTQTGAKDAQTESCSRSRRLVGEFHTFSHWLCSPGTETLTFYFQNRQKRNASQKYF